MTQYVPLNYLKFYNLLHFQPSDFLHPIWAKIDPLILPCCKCYAREFPTSMLDVMVLTQTLAKFKALFNEVAKYVGYESG
jgi:hypothetical protein